MQEDIRESIMEMDYDSLDREIKQSMRRSAGEVVRLGYMLRRMKEEELWAGHYHSMDEYLGKELHMEKTLASRFMAINRRFSVDGDSVEIDTRYRDYSQSLLVEMLGMPPELAEKITPGMTARQAREIKREAREEDMDGEYTDEGIPGQTDIVTDFPEWLPEGYQAGEEGAAGMPCLAAGSGKETTETQSRETGSPEGARTWEEGEAAEAATPQQPELAKPDEKAYQYLDDFARRFIRFKHDWLVEDHGSRVDDVTKSPGEIRGHLGENGRTWYFPSGKDSAAHINLLDGYVQLFDGTGIHLGDFDWFYVAAAIRRMWNVVSREMAGEGRTGTVDPAGAGSREAETREEPEARYTDPGEEVAMSQQGPEEEPDEDPGDGLRGIKRLLEEESRKLDSYLEVSLVEGIPEKLLFRQKTIVAALAAMVCDRENAAPGEERSQPPLPLLKNNDQRKDWLKDYKAWGLWYRDTNIGVDYYKYDFENGARLVAEGYAEHGEYTGDYEYHILHLVGGPEPPKEGHGWGKWTRHDRYSRYPNSETELVEFLKYTQGKEERRK